MSYVIKFWLFPLFFFIFCHIQTGQTLNSFNIAF